MVALAVFSLAALALIRLEGATFRGAATLDATLVAQIVARNVAVDALTDAQPPDAGRAPGRDERRPRLALDAQVSPVGDARVLRIDVAVADRAGGARQLTMVRRRRPVPPTCAAACRPRSPTPAPRQCDRRARLHADRGDGLAA